MELLDFYQAIHAIKHKQRNGWKKIGVTGVIDTIASHSYGATLLAWIRAKELDLDENKFIKMMLIHDLIMAFVDDSMPEQTEYETKRDQENAIAQQLLDKVPSSIKEEFAALFAEYQREKTEEAKFARECDKLDTLLQAYMYSKQLGRDHLTEFIDFYEKKFNSDSGKKIIQELKGKTKELS